MMTGFTDLHQHLLYGIDDGPKTFPETRAMVRAAQRNGIINIVATPHVTPGIKDFDLDGYFDKLDRTRTYCFRQSLGVEIFPGAEIFYTEQTVRLLKEHRVLTLAETDIVLVEFSVDIPYEKIFNAAADLLRGGYLPLLAHIERYACFLRNPQHVYDMKRELDVYYQINCSTVLGNKGYSINRFCKRLLSDELIDAVATDTHNLDSRPVLMQEAYELLLDQYGQDYADRLTGLRDGLIPIA